MEAEVLGRRTNLCMVKVDASRRGQYKNDENGVVLEMREEVIFRGT